MSLGRDPISLYETDSPRVIIMAYTMKGAIDVYNLWLKDTKKEMGDPISIKYLGSESTTGNVFE